MSTGAGYYLSGTLRPFQIFALSFTRGHKLNFFFISGFGVLYRAQ